MEFDIEKETYVELFILVNIVAYQIETIKQHIWLLNKFSNILKLIWHFWRKFIETN